MRDHGTIHEQYVIVTQESLESLKKSFSHKGIGYTKSLKSSQSYG